MEAPCGDVCHDVDGTNGPLRKPPFADDGNENPALDVPGTYPQVNGADDASNGDPYGFANVDVGVPFGTGMRRDDDDGSGIVWAIPVTDFGVVEIGAVSILMPRSRLELKPCLNLQLAPFPHRPRIQKVQEWPSMTWLNAQSLR